MESNVDKKDLLPSNRNLFTKQYDKNDLLYIWYTAKTELYDRALYHADGLGVYNRRASNLYALQLRKIIKNYYKDYSESNAMKLYPYSTQYIIDLYNYLLEYDEEMKAIENNLDSKCY